MVMALRRGWCNPLGGPLPSPMETLPAAKPEAFVFSTHGSLQNAAVQNVIGTRREAP